MGRIRREIGIGIAAKNLKLIFIDHLKIYYRIKVF